MMRNKMTRRGFLGWTATGAAGLLLPALVGPAPKVFDMGRSLRGHGAARMLLYDQFGRVVDEIPAFDGDELGPGMDSMRGAYNVRRDVTMVAVELVDPRVKGIALPARFDRAQAMMNGDVLHVTVRRTFHA